MDEERLPSKKFNKKQENAMCCNNRDNLLQLSFTLKISIFWSPVYNPVESL